MAQFCIETAYLPPGALGGSGGGTDLQHILNTLWLSMMSGKAMMLLLPMRVNPRIIEVVELDAALFYLITKRMESLGLVRMIRKFQAGDAGGFVLSKGNAMDSEVCRHGGCMPPKGTVYEKCIILVGKQMREKAVSRSREHSKDVALCGVCRRWSPWGHYQVVIPTVQIP